MLNVGIIQMQSEPLRVDINLSRAERHIIKCVQEGAQLVVLPEVFNVGFYLGESLMMVAETLDGKTMNWLKAQATRHNIHITGSIYEIYEKNFYNTMVMVGSDGSVQFYRKRNPSWSEVAVWKRSDAPGPAIFDTPLGRIGGVICFDSFTRETFEGFKKSRVELIVIVACWGAPRLSSWRPDLVLARSSLIKWSYVASEIVPCQYAQKLNIPVVFVNQGGTIQTSSPVPFPDWPVRNSKYDFIGKSHARDASGNVLKRATNSESDFCAVVPVNIQPAEKRPEIERIDIPHRYLSRDFYYFVEPPFTAKLFQEWFFRGLAAEYESRRVRHGWTHYYLGK